MTKQRTQRSHKRFALWLLLALILGVGARLLLLATTPRLLRWDEPSYLWLGRNFWAGRGYTEAGWPDLHYPPLFSLLVGGLERLVPALGVEGPSNLLYIVCGVLLALPVYKLAKLAIGSEAAGPAAVLAVVLPTVLAGPLFWGTMTEPLYLLLLASLFLTAWYSLCHGYTLAYLASGALIALAYLTRSEGVAYLLWLWLVHFAWRASKGHLWQVRTWVQAVLPLVAFLLVASPYLFYLYAETGRLMLSGKPGLTWDIGTAILRDDPAAYDAVGASLDQRGERLMWFSPERFEHSILDRVRADPGEFLWRIRRNFFLLRRDVIDSTLLPLWLITLTILGWLYRSWERRRLAGELFLASTLLPLSGFLFFHVEQRFFAPLILPFTFWAGQGLYALANWLHGTINNLVSPWYEQAAWSRVAMILAMVLVLVACAWTTRAIVLEEAPRLAMAHKTAGIWLRHNTLEDAVIMTRNLAINLYADREWAPFAYTDDLQTALEFGRRHGATHLVADEWELTRARPHLSYLLKDQTVPELDLLVTVPALRGRTTYIWELR